ncbi:MAG: cation:proton antiporter [Bdellovibrionota bacterium]
MHLLDILALLAGALMLAKVLGGLGDRVGIPSVLVELITGVALGNMVLPFGLSFQSVESSEIVKALAELGALFLLFIVGLETDIKEISRVGVDAFLSACAGVVAPFVLALGVVPLFLDESSFQHNLFIAAALTATSVGITARLLKDSGKLSSLSGQIILGAAVIDDVLGILVLSIVTAMVSHGAVSALSISTLVAKIFVFALLILILRRFFLPTVLKRFRTLEISGTVTTFLLAFCLISAWVSESLGLAGIIGAFALGVALDDVQFQGYRETENVGLDKLMKPITDFLAPVFFIAMGMSVKLSALYSAGALRLGVVLIICGIIGKLACGLAIRTKTAKKGADRLLIGLGMIPRGEVGLIFAAVGLKIGVLDDIDYAAVIAMVVFTTLLAPLAVAWRGRRI